MCVNLFRAFTKTETNTIFLFLYYCHTLVPLKRLLFCSTVKFCARGVLHDKIWMPMATSPESRYMLANVFMSRIFIICWTVFVSVPVIADDGEQESVDLGKLKTIDLQDNPYCLYGRMPTFRILFWQLHQGQQGLSTRYHKNGGLSPNLPD